MAHTPNDVLMMDTYIPPPPAPVARLKFLGQLQRSLYSGTIPSVAIDAVAVNFFGGPLRSADIVLCIPDDKLQLAANIITGLSDDDLLNISTPSEHRFKHVQTSVYVILCSDVAVRLEIFWTDYWNSIERHDKWGYIVPKINFLVEHLLDTCNTKALVDLIIVLRLDKEWPEQIGADISTDEPLQATFPALCGYRRMIWEDVFDDVQYRKGGRKPKS